MPQTSIVRINGQWRVSSWTDGPKKAYVVCRQTEDDFLAYLLWLENHGLGDTADWLLQQYCRKK